MKAAAASAVATVGLLALLADARSGACAPTPGEGAGGKAQACSQALMYADQVMYVSEIFKVENGRITHIDNIGLRKPGLAHTTGFGARR